MTIRHPPSAIRHLLGPFALALLSSGCVVVSLQPVYDEGSITLDHSLLGVWENAEDRTSITVERGEWRSYRITFTDRFGSIPLAGYETRIGDERFLDVTPEHGLERVAFLVLAHGVYRVRVNDGALLASALNYDWLRRAVDRRSLTGVSYTIDTKQNVVLTSGTKELRAWIATNLNHPDLFADAMTFRRKQ